MTDPPPAPPSGGPHPKNLNMPRNPSLQLPSTSSTTSQPLNPRAAAFNPSSSALPPLAKMPGNPNATNNLCGESTAGNVAQPKRFTHQAPSKVSAMRGRERDPLLSDGDATPLAASGAGAGGEGRGVGVGVGGGGGGGGAGRGGFAESKGNAVKAADDADIPGQKRKDRHSAGTADKERLKSPADRLGLPKKVGVEDLQAIPPYKAAPSHVGTSISHAPSTSANLSPSAMPAADHEQSEDGDVDMDRYGQEPLPSKALPGAAGNINTLNGIPAASSAGASASAHASPSSTSQGTGYTNPSSSGHGSVLPGTDSGLVASARGNVADFAGLQGGIPQPSPLGNSPTPTFPSNLPLLSFTWPHAHPIINRLGLVLRPGSAGIYEGVVQAGEMLELHSKCGVFKATVSIPIDSRLEVKTEVAASSSSEPASGMVTSEVQSTADATPAVTAGVVSGQNTIQPANAPATPPTATLPSAGANPVANPSQPQQTVQLSPQVEPPTPRPLTLHTKRGAAIKEEEMDGPDGEQLTKITITPPQGHLAHLDCRTKWGYGIFDSEELAPLFRSLFEALRDETHFKGSYPRCVRDSYGFRQESALTDEEWDQEQIMQKTLNSLKRACRTANCIGEEVMMYRKVLMTSREGGLEGILRELHPVVLDCVGRLAILAHGTGNTLADINRLIPRLMSLSVTGATRDEELASPMLFGRSRDPPIFESIQSILLTGDTLDRPRRKAQSKKKPYVTVASAFPHHSHAIYVLAGDSWPSLPGLGRAFARNQDYTWLPLDSSDLNHVVYLHTARFEDLREDILKFPFGGPTHSNRCQRLALTFELEITHDKYGNEPEQDQANRKSLKFVRDFIQMLDLQGKFPSLRLLYIRLHLHLWQPKHSWDEVQNPYFGMEPEMTTSIFAEGAAELEESIQRLAERYTGLKRVNIALTYTTAYLQDEDERDEKPAIPVTAKFEKCRIVAATFAQIRRLPEGEADVELVKEVGEGTWDDVGETAFSPEDLREFKDVFGFHIHHPGEHIDLNTAFQGSLMFEDTDAWRHPQYEMGRSEARDGGGAGVGAGGGGGQDEDEAEGGGFGGEAEQGGGGGDGASLNGAELGVAPPVPQSDDTTGTTDTETSTPESSTDSTTTDSFEDGEPEEG